MSLISFVMPAYRESTNLRVMVERIEQLRAKLAPDEVEAVFVDDHSPDDTPRILGELSRAHAWVRWARLARNSGSHTAILCGLNLARGDAAIILASDGQDPPELAAEMVPRWRAGAGVVWGARRGYKRSLLDRSTAWAYYKAMNLLSHVHRHPTGADMVLLDRRVLDTVKASQERGAGLWEYISWLGFAQDTVFYDKADRLAGVSGWTFRKKLRAAFDNLLGFSHAPIRFMSCSGLLMAFVSLGLAGLYTANRLAGGAILGLQEAPGWTSLMVVILFLAGAQMLMLGVIGEYIWRIMDQVRGRPIFLIEHCSDEEKGAGPS